jgi:hypothetical protein
MQLRRAQRLFVLGLFRQAISRWGGTRGDVVASVTELQAGRSLFLFQVRSKLADCLDNVEASTSHKPLGVRGLLRGQLEVFFLFRNTRHILDGSAVL